MNLFDSFEKRRNTDIIQMVEPLTGTVGQWALGLLLTSVIFSAVYWLKKHCGNLRRPPQEKPPKILTDQYWPVKNAILNNLSLEDLLTLKTAYPSLHLQKWEDNMRTKFIREVTELHDDSWFTCLDHSHSAHPIFVAIKEKSQLYGLESKMKMEEIKQMTAKLGNGINRLPGVEPKFDASLLTQNVELECEIEGFTPLLYCATLDDLDTLRLLVENGSDIYQTAGPIQVNCLHAAVIGPYGPALKVARFLLEELRMNKEKQTSEGQTALDLVRDLVDEEFFDPDDPEYIELVRLLR